MAVTTLLELDGHERLLNDIVDLVLKTSRCSPQLCNLIFYFKVCRCTSCGTASPPPTGCVKFVDGSTPSSWTTVVVVRHRDSIRHAIDTRNTSADNSCDIAYRPWDQGNWRQQDDASTWSPGCWGKWHPLPLITWTLITPGRTMIQGVSI